MAVMRFVFATIGLLLIAPALAADWGFYQNSRYGYEIAVPPDFVGGGESASGDGQAFRSRDGARTLLVWGGFLTAGDFSAKMVARQEADAADGWALSYQASSPRWVSYSGTRNGSILYVRAIARCDGQYAMFRLEYPKADAVRFNPVVDRLVQTLREGRC